MALVILSGKNCQDGLGKTDCNNSILNSLINGKLTIEYMVQKCHSAEVST